jgi:hypothetical protein
MTADIARITIPRGRSAAEKRLNAIAALHQPLPAGGSPQVASLLGPTCGQCRGIWPCATALLLGAWPNETEET